MDEPQKSRTRTNRSLGLAVEIAASDAGNPVSAAAAERELFSLSDVRLTGGPLLRQQEANRAYLLRLDPDRLLSWFRKEAGLEPKAPPYRGWESEDPFLPGHILGFFMSGAAMTVQATGDAVLRERLLYIVDQIREIQRAHGSGYVLAVPNGRALFEDIAAGQIKITGLPWNGYKINDQFEPTYTMNKILLGLGLIHRATGSEDAKRAFLDLSDWFGEVIVDRLDDERLQTLLQCEHGSMPETFADAYVLTGDEKYLRWARRLCHERMLEPLASGDGDFLTHFHANSNIPKYTGFQSVYRLTGERRLHDAALNAWSEIVSRRSWVIGGNSVSEHFFPPEKFAEALRNPVGPETCNSINMLRLTEALYLTAPNAGMLDFYERVLFNHILAAHDPERCMTAYYTPLFPGAYRVYGDEFDSMWCCTGTGLEAPGKYGRMIYALRPGENALEVNLFAASELDWRDKGVVISQETGFPFEPGLTLRITEAPAGGSEFALLTRRPAWAREGVSLRLNGRPADSAAVGDSHVGLRRAWQKGDVLRVELPMRLGVEALPQAPEYVAFTCGPIVLSAELGRSGGLEKEDFWGLENKVPRKLIPETAAPAVVAEPGADLTRMLRPVPGAALRFRSEGFAPAQADLVPFFENHFQRYAVYFRRISPGRHAAEQASAAREAAELAGLEARTVDRVLVGDARSEREHRLQGVRTETGSGAHGSHPGRLWRHALDKGWFGYMLSPGKTPGPLSLRITLWNREPGPRTFDVFVEGSRIATLGSGHAGDGDWAHHEIRIPGDLVSGKTRINARFRPHAGNIAGGVFDLRLVRGETE